MSQYVLELPILAGVKEKKYQLNLLSCSPRNNNNDNKLLSSCFFHLTILELMIEIASL